MDEVFRKGVEAVRRFLDAEEYSQSVRYNYERCYRILGAQLELDRVPYSNDYALKWLYGAEESLTHSQFKAARMATYRLVDACSNGEVTQARYVNETSSIYMRCPDWGKLIIDSFILEYADGVQSQKSIYYARMRCACFIFFAASGGANSAEEIDAHTVMKYRDSVAANQKSTRALRLNLAARLLDYMASLGIIPRFLAMLMDDRYSRHASLFEFVDGDPPVQDGSLDADSFLDLAQSLVNEVLREAGYLKNVLQTTRKALELYYIYLGMNNERYSFASGMGWVKANATGIGTCWKAYRRAIWVFEQYYSTGSVDLDAQLPCTEAFAKTPAWARSMITSYLELVAREGFAESTQATIRSACIRFTTYADNHGIDSFADVTPALVLEFCIEDPHSTTESSALYSSKVRGFLKYLEEEGEVPQGLSYAAARKHVVYKKPVKVLNSDQITTINQARSFAETPMELREAAMLSLGLYEGLRSGDVVNLRLDAISWSEGTISITQGKTNKHLVLPLCAEAGNSVHRYLIHGRPNISSPYVFIKHRTPFTQINKSACRRAMRHVLGDSYDGLGGFHVLRKTFASGVLRGGAKQHDVAEVLGHSTDGTVYKYLHLDEERMRMCALPLVPVGGDCHE